MLVPLLMVYSPRCDAPVSLTDVVRDTKSIPAIG